MSKNKLRRNLGRFAILMQMVLIFTFVLNINAEAVYANKELANYEEQQLLEGYDLSSVKYSIYDGKNYYDYSENGVSYSKKPCRIIVTGLPKELKARCIGDAQVNPGEYPVKIEIYEKGTNNIVAYNELVLKVNKGTIDMSNSEFYDSNIAYDGQVHELQVTNLPQDVKIEHYEGNGVKEPGSWQIIAYPKYYGMDASNYNEIAPLKATLTIVDGKDPNKLNYNEDTIRFKNSTFSYDGREHSIIATGIPEDVSVTYTGNKNIEKGTYQVTAHFKGDDAHNPILDRTALVTIVSSEVSSFSNNATVENGIIGKPEGPGNTNKPSEDKPVGPGNTNKPSEDKPVGPTNPDKPVEQHVWGSWTYKDDAEDERECSHCGIKETNPHNYTSINVVYTDNQDATHTVLTTYSCTQCLNDYTSTEQKDCDYSNWQYIGNSIDANYCNNCNSSITRIHEHQEEPSDLLYISSSNGDGTHKLQASYLCAICSEEVDVIKNENCDYGEVTYTQIGINDTHIENRDCKVCNYHTEKEGTCVPVGELKCIKKYAQIYDYYDCGLCGDWCQRVYHTVHRFGPWEYRDADTHIKYCVCGSEASGGRVIADHSFKYDKDNFTGVLQCDECGTTKDVPEHNHGYDVKNEMDLMQLLSSPAYNELLSNSQFKNPNPGPDVYCSRYEFKCKICGIKYYAEYAHKFVDGKCTRVGYCGGIEQAKPIDLILATVEKLKVNTLTKGDKPNEIPKVEETITTEEETKVEETITTEEETKVEETMTTEEETKGEGILDNNVIATPATISINKNNVKNIILIRTDHFLRGIYAPLFIEKRHDMQIM